MIDAQKTIPDFSPLSWPDDYLMSRAQNLTGNTSVTDIGPLRICWCVELYD